MQNEDGGWAAFDRGNHTGLVQCIPFCDFGEVVDPSSADVTAHVLELAGKLGFSRSEPHVRRGLAYLLAEQERDGSWYGRWGVNYVYGTSAALQALSALRFGAADTPVAAATAWLRRRQNEDGGWGESNDSYAHPHLAARRTASTPYQSAWALLALLAAGEVASDAVRCGVEFLMRSQQPDGLWSARDFTAPGFPRVFYLRYHGYCAYFPLWALATYRTLSRVGTAH
jgi:squalene-hopene/tetraprenyl-beta-curcumene cyclase